MDGKDTEREGGEKLNLGEKEQRCRGELEGRNVLGRRRGEAATSESH